jgi:hypothetical protein
VHDDAVDDFDGIVTNPALGKRGELGVIFIEVGLIRMNSGFLALLLPVDFDAAVTRRHLFSPCSKFAGKIVLTERIKWFDMPRKSKSPKENTAWFLRGNVPFRMPPRKHPLRTGSIIAECKRCLISTSST